MNSQQLNTSVVFVPVNFQADSLLQNERGNITLKHNLKDAMHYILHTLIQISSRQDSRHRMEQSGLLTMNATVLKSICGTHYAEALRILEKNNVIIIERSYQVGKKSMGYCLIEPYASAESIAVSLSENGGTCKRLMVHKQKQQAKNDTELERIKYITKWFDKDRLTVNLQYAHDFIEFYSETLRGQISDAISRPLRADINNRINQRYNAAIGSIKRIVNGEFNLYRLGQDHRLHSTISSIMKEFRSFLIFDCQPFIGVDVKASQPFLFTQLLNPEFFESGPGITVTDVYPELHEILLQDPHRIEHIKNIIMLLTSSISEAPQRSFLNIDWTKDFYQQLIDLEKALMPIKPLFRNRISVKKTMMFLLYSKEKYKYKVPEWKVFEKLFPVEARLISFFDNLSRLYKRNFLPILLQRLESTLMLDVICKEISRQVPNAPIIPIHDSVLTLAPYITEVAIIIKNTLFKKTGFVPGLTIESKSADEVRIELNDIAVDDYRQILDDSHFRMHKYLVGRKKPLLTQIPRLDNRQILSTKYIDPTIYG